MVCPTRYRWSVVNGRCGNTSLCGVPTVPARGVTVDGFQIVTKTREIPRHSTCNRYGHVTIVCCSMCNRWSSFQPSPNKRMQVKLDALLCNRYGHVATAVPCVSVDAYNQPSPKYARHVHMLESRAVVRAVVRGMDNTRRPLLRLRCPAFCAHIRRSFLFWSA